MSLAPADALSDATVATRPRPGSRNPAELVILDGFAEPLGKACSRVVDRPFRDRAAEPDHALTEHRGE